MSFFIMGVAIKFLTIDDVTTPKQLQQQFFSNCGVLVNFKFFYYLFTNVTSQRNEIMKLANSHFKHSQVNQLR